jgi:hypothetical protein
MWRIQAKQETVCPRCKGYIKRNAWIVQDPAYGTKWAHAVCPADLRKKAAEPAESTVIEEYRPVYDADGNHVGMEIVNVASES